ncbi:MAG: murein hydrolase activator EnvC family protein [Bradymonadia bacterium]
MRGPALSGLLALGVSLAAVSSPRTTEAAPEGRRSSRQGERALLERIDALDRVIVQLALQQAETRARLQKQQRALDYLEQSVTEFQTTVEARKALVQQRLRARGRLDDVAWLRILLGAQDPTDVVLRRDWLRRVLRHDARLITELQQSKRAWADATAARKVAVAQIEEETASLERQRASLERERGERAGLLAGLRGQSDTGLAGKGHESVSTRFEAERGRLPMPTPGRIVTRFGLREEPELGTRIENKGVEIDAQLGAPVRAVHAGRVVFAGTYLGFGNLMIVSHGDGWHTLYAHLDSFTRAPDEVVRGGDVLGVVGDSGSLRGPMLYFELRRHRKAIDPESFFATR